MVDRCGLSKRAGYLGEGVQGLHRPRSCVFVGRQLAQDGSLVRRLTFNLSHAPLKLTAVPMNRKRVAGSGAVAPAATAIALSKCRCHARKSAPSDLPSPSASAKLFTPNHRCQSAKSSPSIAPVPLKSP